MQTAFEAQNSCVYFLRRQPAPRGTALCSFFKWAVSPTFKRNLRPPASLPLKFLPLSSSPSSFSSYFRIQKGNFLLITLPLHISFYSCVMLFINCLLFMVLSLFLLYPTQTQRERSIYIVLQLYTLCGLNRWGKLFCCAFEDTENKAIKDSQVLMF